MRWDFSKRCKKSKDGLFYDANRIKDSNSWQFFHNLRLHSENENDFCFRYISTISNIYGCTPGDEKTKYCTHISQKPFCYSCRYHSMTSVYSDPILYPWIVKSDESPRSFTETKDMLTKCIQPYPSSSTSSSSPYRNPMILPKPHYCRFLNRGLETTEGPYRPGTKLANKGIRNEL